MRRVLVTDDRNLDLCNHHVNIFVDMVLQIVQRALMAGSGKRLEKLRKTLGLSQADVARRSGLTRSEISRWEAGEREVAETKRVRVALARAFDLDPVLVGGYLEGFRPLEAVLPPPAPPRSPLRQALDLERPGRWSEAAVTMAEELESKLKAESKKLTVPEWVRQLDALQEESRKTIKSAWERLIEDEDLGS